MVMNYIRRAYSSFSAHVFDIPMRLLALLFLLILLVVPLTGIGSTYLTILITANVLSIFALSWDLLVGRTGQISLGHALFYGVGGYTTALLFKYYNLPIWVTIPAAMSVGVLLSILVGFPCLRVKGPYLALVSMAFPLILLTIVRWNQLDPIFGSEIGIRGLPTFFPFLNIIQRPVANYYLTLLLLFVSGIIIYKIANSKTGIVFLSILDDEVASKACGINITKHKLMSFIISGLFASLAGCIHVHWRTFATPVEMFSLSVSLMPLITTFLGGIGTIYGAIIGSYIYVLLDRYVMPDLLPSLLKQFNVALDPNTAEFSSVKLLAFALIVLIIVIKWPRGVARFATDKLEDLEEARDLDERGPRIWKRYKKKKKD